MNKKTIFWQSFMQALDAEPKKDIKSIAGASGLSHPVISLAIDGARDRVIIISGEADPRAAAMAQADIQATMPSAKVMLARPVAFNLSAAAEVVTKVIGKATITVKEWLIVEQYSNRAGKVAQRIPKSAQKRLRKKANKFLKNVSLNNSQSG